MQLSLEEQRLLSEVLDVAYPNPSTFGDFLLEFNLDIVALQLNKPNAIDLYLHVIRSFPGNRLKNFLERLLEEHPHIEKLQTFYRKLLARIGAPAIDLRERCCLLMGASYFVNRHTLRNVIEEIAQEFGPRVLIVDGPPRSGRSYSAMYIRHFCGVHGGQNFVSELKRQYLGKKAIDLVREIALFFNWDLQSIPVQHAQATQWAEELGAWVAGKIRQSEETIWLVFDDAGAYGLDQSIREFIIYLANRSLDVPQMRVILLAYAEPMVGPAKMALLQESISPPSLLDLEKFLGDFCELKDYEVDDPTLKMLAQNIWDRLPNDENRLEHLAHVTRTTLKVITDG